MCCDSFLDVDACPSCGSTRTEQAHDLYAVADAMGIGHDSDSDALGLPSSRSLGAVWSELHAMYDDSGNWADVLG